MKQKLTYLFSLLLTAFFLLPWSEMKADDLTVASGTKTTYQTPIYGYYCDRYVRSQIIYPASMLTVMNGKAIAAMTFYFETPSAAALTSTFQVYLKEVTSSTTALSTTWADMSDATKVYEGTVEANNTTTNTMVIEFDTPFSYNGGSLIFDIKNTASGGSYANKKYGEYTCVFYGRKAAADEYSTLTGYSSSATITPSRGDIRPKTTFTYGAAGCTTPTITSAAQETSTSASISWTAGSTETAWQLSYREKTSPESEWSTPYIAVSTTPAHTLTGLTTDKTYQVKVRSNCGDGEENKSEWTDATEFSLVSCPSVTEVTLGGKVYNGVTVNWTTSAPTKCDVRYKASDDENWTSAETNTSATSKTITGLVVGKTYSFQVKPNCSADGWVAAGETYIPAFPVPAPSVSDQTDAQATVSWSALLDNPNYKYIRVAAGSAAPDAEAWAAAASTDQTSVTLTGLAGGTSYDVYVRAVYASGEGEPAMVNFTTGKIAPTDLVQGETTTSSIAFSWSYAGAATQFQWRSSKSGSDWSAPISVTNAEETGLDDGESYTFDVRAYYADGIYSSLLSGSFATACAAKALPYSCGFENSDADVFTNNGYNTCWKKIGSPYASTSTTYKHAGSRGLYIGGTDEQYAILPEFADAVKGMQITFWYKNYFPSSYSSTLVLGSMTDPTDKTTFTAIKTLDASGSFVQIVEQSLATAGTNDKYIAFKYTGSNQYSSIGLDDILVEVLPTCPKPTSVTVPAENITGTTAQVSWTENGSATAWKLQTSNDGTNWSDAIAADANPFTLTGLTPNKTTYYVRVMADCGAGDVSAWSAASEPFETPCATIISFPWNENFSGMTAGKVPSCWDNSNSGTSTISSYPERVWGVYEYSSNKMLRMYNYYVQAGTALINTPSIVLPASPKYEFSFDYAHNASCGNFVVKVSTDGGSSFTAIDGASYAKGSGSSYSAPGDFTPTTIDLSSYAGQTIILQFFATSDYNSGAIFLDNLSIHEKPSCAIPSEVKGEGTSTTTASISWTAGGEETAWKLQYSTDGENWIDANEGNNITTNPYELTGLTAGATYYARVMADCGGSLSEWSAASAAFKTDCNAVEMPFEEAFDATLPECWKMVTVGDNSWGASSNTYYRHSASYSWSYSAYTSADNYSDLITPAIVLDEDALLKFYVSNYAYSGTNVIAEVYIQYGSTTEKIFDIPTISTGYTPEQQVIDLSDYTGKTAKFIFRAHGNGQTSYKYIYIDDVEVKAKPCDAPTALNVAASSSDATITWTDEANSKWNLRWREVTDPESVWTLVEDLTARTLTLTKAANGLEVGKTYQVQVQAECSDTKQSDWTAVQTFELICNAPTALAVTARAQNSATFSWTSSETAWVLQFSADGENWESENVATNPFTLTGLTAETSYQAKIQSACGSAFSNTVSFTTWCGTQDAADLPIDITSFGAVPACWEASFKGEYSGVAGNKICFYGTEEQWLVLPAYDINLNQLSVTFTFTVSGATPEFGYIDEPNGTFHAFSSAVTSGEELNLEAEAAAVKYIAVRYPGGSSDFSNVTISAVNIRRTPGCAKLDAPTATPAVGAAEISWTAGSETAWNLQYKLASAADWTTIAVTENPYTLNALEQGVSYKVRVQANCGEEGTGDWSDEVSFTTDCEAITAVPFYADFSQALSNCWTVYAGSSYYTPAVNTFSQDLNISGGKSGNSDNVVVMPAISADLTNAVLSFEYRGSTGANYAQLEVGYLTDKSDASTFQSLQVLDQASTYTEARVAVNGLENKYLAFKYAGGSSQGDQYIKNLRVINAYNLSDAVDNSTLLSNLNGQTLDVTIGRTFVRAEYYNTICLPFSLSAEELAASPIATEDLWAFKYAKVDETTGELLFRIVESDHIEAGVPYFIGLAGEGSIENPLFKNVTISATAGKNIGDASVAQLCGIVNQPVIFEKNDQTKLFLAANNTLYWWAGSGNSQLNSFRAYFKVNVGGSNNAPIHHGMRARIIKEEQTATGCENINADGKAVKLLENNQVIIIRNGVKYTVQGQKIQ